MFREFFEMFRKHFAIFRNFFVKFPELIEYIYFKRFYVIFVEMPTAKRNDERDANLADHGDGKLSATLKLKLGSQASY